MTSRIAGFTTVTAGIHLCLTAVAASLLAAPAQAADTAPFAVSVAASGAGVTQSALASTHDSTSVVQSDFYVLTETTPAGVGTPGAVNVYSARDTTVHTNTYTAQAFDVQVSSSGSDFTFAGRVDKTPGITLLNGGNGYLSVSLGGWAAALNALNDNTLSARFTVQTDAFTYNRSLRAFVDEADGTYVYQARSWAFNFNDALPITFTGSVTTTGAVALFPFSFGLNGDISVLSGTTTQTTTSKTLLQTIAIAALPAPMPAVPESGGLPMALVGLLALTAAARQRRH